MTPDADEASRATDEGRKFAEAVAMLAWDSPLSTKHQQVVAWLIAEIEELRQALDAAKRALMSPATTRRPEKYPLTFPAILPVTIEKGDEQ